MLELTIFGVMFALGFIVLFPIFLASQREYRRQDAAAVVGTSTRDRVERPRSYETASTYTIPAAPVVAEVAQPMAPAGPPVLPFQTVLQYIGPRCIHLLIVGETHSGKSTSARGVLAGRIQAGDQIAILDPHGNPTNWGGIRAIGAGRNFAAIEQAMVELLAEMTRRYERLAEDANYVPPALSIFVDEWPAIQTACKKAAGQFITELAQEGRKVGMRLVMLTQSDLVASLGIEGKGDIRSNFTMLLLGGKASARADVAGLTWPAALRKGEGVAYPAITDPMPSYEALLDTAAAAIWRSAGAVAAAFKPATDHRPLATPTAHNADPQLDPLWQRFLNGEDLLAPIETGSQEGAQGGFEGEPVAARTSSENGDLAALYQAKPVVRADQETAPTSVPANLPSDELSILIRAAHAAGMSRNKMTQLLVIPGGRADQLKRIKEALGESETGTQ